MYVCDVWMHGSCDFFPFDLECNNNKRGDDTLGEMLNRNAALNKTGQSLFEKVI